MWTGSTERAELGVRVRGRREGQLYYFLSHHLGVRGWEWGGGGLLTRSPFILWRQEWMTKEHEDETRHGSACRWSPLWAHGHMKGGGPERLRSVFHDCGSGKRLHSVGVFPGFQSDVISAPHVSDTAQSEKKNQQKKKPTPHFPSNIWGWG